MEYLILISFFLCTVSSFRDVDFGTPLRNPDPDCIQLPKGRVPWIIAVRNPDYGWKEHSHRANIALAVAGYAGSDDEMRKMAEQLEVEITEFLFRTHSSQIDDNDLALYIHALVATNKNPRDFHGVDLVADLLRRVENTRGAVNPFLVLALCNSHAVEFDHLLKLADSLHLTDFVKNPDVDSIETQLKATAFKAFACAASLSPENKKFISEMDKIAAKLIQKYNAEGRFGNVYTTSLAVQAFMASNKTYRGWNEAKTIAYLQKEAVIDVNLIKAYYIEMALNSNKVRFIKDLYSKGRIVDESSQKKSRLTRSVKNLADVIEADTGRSGLDFLQYGNFCGFGGEGEPVDPIDKCCEKHDICYQVVEEGVCQDYGNEAIYRMLYKWRVGDNQTPECDEENNECQLQLCICDVIFSKCLKINLEFYNSSYKKPLNLSTILQGIMYAIG